jgi:hypothetical protein
MEEKYRYNKVAGALQEAAGAPPPASLRVASAPAFAQAAPAPPTPEEAALDALMELEQQEAVLPARRRQTFALGRPAVRAQTVAAAGEAGGGAPPPASSGLDPTRAFGRRGMFSYTIEDGQHVLVIRSDGTMEEVVGPRKVSTWGRRFRAMAHHVAHPGEFLIVRFRDGGQEHLPGPSHVWLDPRKHLSISKEDALQIATKEAVVVYSRDEGGEVKRRIVSGPAVFVPEPGEWLHTFSWHGSMGGAEGYRKVPNSLVFQKLWLLPDQMYHDVTDVRTADDAVLTIKLMIFFELCDIETMLATTHDPIGDFVNAATSDTVDFLSRHDLTSFKQSTERLNDLATYRQLVSRAEQCGYRINKVVYRGYIAPPSLQQMLEHSIESRTRLGLERATEQQAQELEDFKQERQVVRAERQRADRTAEITHEIELARRRREEELATLSARLELERRQARLDAEQALALARAQNGEQRAHLEALRGLGVDLTAVLTQGRADQVIELRGDGQGAHLHLSPGAGSPRQTG